MRRPVFAACATIAAVVAGSPALAGSSAAGRTVRDPVWGVELRVPGYEPADHPLRGQSNFIMAASAGERACRLNLSLFVSQVAHGATPAECRENDVGDPDALSSRDDVDLVEEKAAPVAYSLFDRTLESKAGAQRMFHELGGFPGKAMGILRSVRVGRDTGATLETVEFAKRKGGDPRDWRLHLMVAQAYLRDEDHRNPARARRFYESALQIGGPRLKEVDRLAIEQGLGLTWLAEENGREAIPHLERALQLARLAEQGARRRGSEDEAPGGTGDRQREAIYALASAQAMSGNVAASCGYARRWLQAQDVSELKPAAKKIRKDPQMEALTGSECYQALLSDLGLR